MALQIILPQHLQVVQPLTFKTLCSSGTGEMNRRYVIVNLWLFVYVGPGIGFSPKVI